MWYCLHNLGLVVHVSQYFIQWHLSFKEIKRHSILFSRYTSFAIGLKQLCMFNQYSNDVSTWYCCLFGSISCLIVMNFIVAVHDYVWNSFVMLLQGVLSSAPDIIANTLHAHHDHSNGDHHHGIDLEHPVLALSMTTLAISVKEGWVRALVTMIMLLSSFPYEMSCSCQKFLCVQINCI